MIFSSDNQRRAVFASFNRFAKMPSKKMKEVKVLDQKLAGYLDKDVDPQAIDTYAMHDSTLTPQENFAKVILELRQQGMVSDFGAVPSKEEEAHRYVSDIISNENNIDRIYDQIKDDRYLMSKFRSDIMRAIFAGIIKDDGYAAQYLAEHDKTFDDYLSKLIQARRMPSAEIVKSGPGVFEIEGPVVSQTIKLEDYQPEEKIVFPDVEYTYEKV